jgi:hypothetical protein
VNTTRNMPIDLQRVSHAERSGGGQPKGSVIAMTDTAGDTTGKFTYGVS